MVISQPTEESNDTNTSSKQKMAAKQSVVDTRSELADLVKRKAEVAVS